ncbi:MAG: hypothetical protein Q8Q09_19715 [Deltaproteobacteria bacterium]|nr:hypothetical protein [Deltaproteobacteria bacterium]
MKSWVGRTVFVGMSLLVSACKPVTEIVVRVFQHPRTEADFRVVTVLRGQRIGPALTAHFDPARPATPTRLLAVIPAVEFRLIPAGPMYEYERLCLDVQRRASGSTRVQSVRICTQFLFAQRAIQDVYFGWSTPGPGDPLGGRAGPNCPLPAPNCWQPPPHEQARLENSTAPLPASAALVHDPDWGDLDNTAPEDSPRVCAYQCPALVAQQVRAHPDTPDASDARDASDASDASDARDTATDTQTSDSEPHSMLPICMQDASRDVDATDAACAIAPP